jgi:uncharacterized OsmC-like protein
MRSEVSVRDCKPVLIDEPPGRGGLYEYPTPAEYTISAIAGCSVAHIELFAQDVGLQLEDCRVEGGLTLAHFEPDDERGKNGGVLGIDLKFFVTFSGTEEQFQAVQRLFRDRCVLYRFAKSAAPLTERWELIPAGR